MTDTEVPPKKSSDGIDETARLLARPISRLARMIYGLSHTTVPRGMRSALFALGSGPLRMSQIAAQEGIDQGAASRLVRRLEDQGLVRRESGEPDRRVVMVTLTEEGEKRLEVMREESQRVLRDVLGDFNAKERREIQRASVALQALLEHVEERVNRGDLKRPDTRPSKHDD